MTAPIPAPQTNADIAELFTRTRARSDALVQPLSAEDMMLQSMTDASPAKWHLAHTTWFFEEFLELFDLRFRRRLWFCCGLFMLDRVPPGASDDDVAQRHGNSSTAKVFFGIERYGGMGRICREELWCRS